MPKRRNPFDIAVISLLLAIGMPCVVFMFGTVRSRQLQSKANPRWAQFSKMTAPDAGSTSSDQDSVRIAVRTASIRTKPLVEAEAIHHSNWDSHLTGSATGHRSIELPVRPEPTAQLPAEQDGANHKRKPAAEQPIVFRPVDDVREADVTKSPIFQSTQRLESRLVEIDQRLDQLAHLHQQFQSEEINRNAQLFDAMLMLNQTMESKPSDDEKNSVAAPTDERSTSDQATESNSNIPSAPPTTPVDESLPVKQPVETDAIDPFEESKKDEPKKPVIEPQKIDLQNQKPKLLTKIYQPHHLSATELIRLIEPVLSSDGRHSVSPSVPKGVRPSETQGENQELDSYDAVVVHDVVEVIAQIDQILTEMDVPPVHIEIEAKVLCVRLAGRCENGVDMGLLPCRCDTSSACEGGLKQSTLTCSMPTFIRSLGRLAETRVVSSQRIEVVNRQRAELLIGNRVGIQSKPGENIQFAESGTRLLFRPTISPDGRIRVEVHPERSHGTVARGAKVIQQNSTERATHVLVRDGSTIAIGGLISEQIVESPGQGPFIDPISSGQSSTRRRIDGLQRTEMVILLTPHLRAQ